MTEDDKAFLRIVMERSTNAYPHAAFAAFYWSVKHTGNLLDTTGLTGSRRGDVLEGGAFDAWLLQGQHDYAPGSQGLHKLSLTAFQETIRNRRRTGVQPPGFSGTIGVGLFYRLYEFAIVSYAGFPLGHGKVLSQDDVFALLKHWGPKGADGFVSLVRVTDSIAQEPFDILAVVNQKIQDARIEWQRQITPNASFYGRTKRGVRIT